MSKFTGWFTPFLTKTAKYEPVNASMRAVGLGKLADARQHFETVEAPRATNQFIAAISKPVNGLENHYGPFHGNKDVQGWRNHTSNHVGDIAGISVGAVFAAGAAGVGSAGSGAGAGAGAGGAGAGTGAAAGGGYAGETVAAGELTAGAGGTTAATTVAPEVAAGAAAPPTVAGTAAGSSGAGLEAGGGYTGETVTSGELTSGAGEYGGETVQGSELTSGAADAQPYSSDSGGMAQYEADSGNEADPNANPTSMSTDAQAKDDYRQQPQQQQKEKPQFHPVSLVPDEDYSGKGLSNIIATSTKTAKTRVGPALKGLQVPNPHHPIDRNGARILNIQALEREARALEQRIAAARRKGK